MAKALKVGMRVRVSKDCGGWHVAKSLTGRIGVVRSFSAVGMPGIEFSRWRDGHDLMGTLKRGSEAGWYIHAESLTPVDVKHNGKTYRVVRKGKK